MNYEEFFRRATNHPPFPYQKRLAENAWPDVIDVPTGLGKTAAVAIAWAYKAAHQPQAHRRLVWCLPMRVLVEQTIEVIKGWFERLAPVFADNDLPTPRVQTLMGGNVETDWRQNPEVPTVLVGTQDMLLSRALMRGYAMSRYGWPIDFAWLHNDALWVFDETQAMGVAVETSAQLQAFRDAFKTARPTHSIWMSATLGLAQLQTVDHPFENPNAFGLDNHDFALSAVKTRLDAKKSLAKAKTVLEGKGDKYADQLAAEILEAHQPDTLTLVIVNRVARAQDIYRALLKQGRNSTNCGLIHSRYRKPDRQTQMKILDRDGDRIVVSTQVIEAGVDISAKTMFSELGPWSSLVQRFGRCNRYGLESSAQIFWIDVQPKDEKDDLVLPYTFEDLNKSRIGLTSVESGNPDHLKAFKYTPKPEIRPVIRRRDFLELFDTSADIAGDDLDVSRFIRDPSDPDVFLYWRDWQESQRPDDQPEPMEDELCRVSLAAASKLKDNLWSFDPLDDRWRSLKGRSLVPGQIYLLHVSNGGYADQIGFTGKPLAKKGLETLTVISASTHQAESNDADPASTLGVWLTLAEHTQHVVDELKTLSQHLREENTIWLERAARWHDRGKAHQVFQDFICSAGTPPAENIWAKAGGKAKLRPSRRHFRHELASMLAYRQAFPEDLRGAYVVLAHHGKVRTSLRALPDEAMPQTDIAFARGVWTGDTLPAADLGDGIIAPKVAMDLALTRLGTDSWTQTYLTLRESFGVFQLAWWEAILRAADQRASAKEANHV